MLSVGDGLRSCRVGLAAVRRLRHLLQPQALGDRLRPAPASMLSRCDDHPRADRRGLDLAQLERQGVGDVALLDLGLADVELPGLAVVVGERLRPDADAWAASIGAG